MKSPYVWFGGKGPVADVVWRRFGDVPNYVEPFFGSGAVLLNRPPFEGARTETVNDLDAYLTNFWRAVQADPDAVAAHADYPVSELDLHARHDWLIGPGADRVERLRADPEFYDAKVAGWWVWGLSLWIGRGWCDAEAAVKTWKQLPHRADAGKGVQRRTWQQMPLIGVELGIRRGEAADLRGYFAALRRRTRHVRVCCGDFERVLRPSVTVHPGTPTGVFLDPPYAADEHRARYAAADDSKAPPAVRAREWCLENGGDRRFRIALCGYTGEGHEVLESKGWKVWEWKARGGFANAGKGGNENARRERIWFSPHCLHSRPGELEFFA